MRVRSSLQRPFLLAVRSIGRTAGFEPANLRSSRRQPTNAVVMEQADMRDSNPRALKSVQVQFLPAAPIFWTATSMADYAPFKRWNEGSTPSRSTILRPHSLVEERQVLNLLAGVRFSLRPPFLAMSSSDKDAGLSSRLPGFDSRHRLQVYG